MTAKYRRLADHLIDEIRSGRRAPGSPMPSVRDLAAEHGQSTAWRAMQALAAEGWTVATPGAGTFVAERLPVSGRSVEDRLAAAEADIAAVAQKCRIKIGRAHV